VLVRSVTTREPTWTEQDRAEILALADYRASLCPCGCGHPLADTTANEETGPKFSVSYLACHARMELIDAQNAAAKGDSPYGEARMWRTEMKR
jgi:hypothetical protein